MTKCSIVLSTVIMLSISLFRAGNSFAAEEYDVKTYGPKNPIVWNSPVKAAFDHKTHTMEAELECSSCHDNIFSMQRGTAVNSKKFTMAAFTEGKYCGSCHNGDDAFNTASQCESCHFRPSKKIIFNKPVKSVVFEHKIHVDQEEISCETCHREIFAMEQGHVADSMLPSSDDLQVKREYLEKLHSKFCGSCHDSGQAFGYQTRCTVCHIGLKGYNKIYAGEGKSESHGKSHH